MSNWTENSLAAVASNTHAVDFACLQINAKFTQEQLFGARAKISSKVFEKYEF